MQNSLSIPWKRIYDVVLSCGSSHEPRIFAIQTLLSLKEICPFDQGLIFFVDGSGKIVNHYLLDIDESWGTAYRDYYSKEDLHIAQIKHIREVPGQPYVRVTDWAKEPQGEFSANYIRPMNLKYSLGFPLYDPNGLPRLVFAMDRLKECGANFTPCEVESVKAAVLQLNNLYKNFFYRPTRSQAVGQINWDSFGLTPREIEIASLLCQGVSPANVSKSLFVSQSTTYKHIAHIYDKMQVSSRQQLLVKLLGK